MRLEFERGDFIFEEEIKIRNFDENRFDKSYIAKYVTALKINGKFVNGFASHEYFILEFGEHNISCCNSRDLNSKLEALMELYEYHRNAKKLTIVCTNKNDDDKEINLKNGEKIDLSKIDIDYYYTN